MSLKRSPKNQHSYQQPVAEAMAARYACTDFSRAPLTMSRHSLQTVDQRWRAAAS
jgi:hypothetical protein